MPNSKWIRFFIVKKDHMWYYYYGDNMLESDKIKKVFTKILIFISLILGMALFSLIPATIFKIDVEKLGLIAKTIYLISCDLGYILVLYFIYHKSINKDIKNYFKKFGINFETSFKYYFLGLIIMLVSNVIITLFFKEANAGNEEQVREAINNLPLYMIFSVSIYAPFVEEIIFRKSIKEIIPGKNIITKYLYILTSGLIFAGMHLLGQITNPLDYLFLIPYGALGVAFAALYHKTDNIFSTIIMHSLHNTVTIILYFTIGGM